MSLGAFPVRSGNVPEFVEYQLRLLGTGAADPTVEVGGGGMTVTRTGSGAYRIAWAENPGTYVGGGVTVAAATPADVAGHTCIADTWDATNFRFDWTLYNAADAAHDLAANEYFIVRVMFRRGGVAG